MSSRRLTMMLGAARHSATRGLWASLAIATVILLGVVMPAPIAAAAELTEPVLPDLVPDRATGLEFQVCQCSAGPSSLLLRFDGFVHNVGHGALEVDGRFPVTRADGTVEMSDVYQRAYLGTGTPGNVWMDIYSDPPPRMIYESTDGHHHFHWKDAVLTELINADGVVVQAPFAKRAAGFCLGDTESIDPWATPAPYYLGTATLNCGQGNPETPQVVMGVSPGWRDVYPATVPLQWLDLSSVLPGEYRLRSIADPTGAIREADEANNVLPGTDVSLVVPGYTAQDQEVTTRPGSRAVTVSLEAIGHVSALAGAPNPSAPEFEVLRPPQHGVLSEPAGVWTSTPTLVYQPDRGYRGPDDLTYAVRNAAFPGFPSTPATARVLISVG